VQNKAAPHRVEAAVMALCVLVVSFAIKHDRSKTQVVFCVVDKSMHVGNVVIFYNHAVIAMNIAIKIFSHRVRTIYDAGYNRTFQPRKRQAVEVPALSMIL
jgi:hypothetical protein